MAIHRIVCAVAVALTLGAGFVRADNSEADLLRQQEQQRQIQAETEQVVRRLNTMLRVMEIYGVSGNQQKQMMAEMSTTLSGLSKNQMAEVVKRLGEAARTADEKASEDSREKAYESHRVIMVKLHEMMGRFEAVKSLDQAADRFEKHARNQLEQHLQTGQLIRDLDAFNKPDLPPTQKLLISKRMRNSGLEAKRQSDAQNDLDREVSLLVKQVLDIKPKLTSEHQERVKRMETILGESRLQENLTTAAQKLRALGYPNHRLEQFRVANELQWKTATSMMEISRALRVPGDTLAALKEAREKIDQAIAKQEDVKEETAKLEPKQEKEKEPKVEPKVDPKADPKDLKFPDLTQLPKADPKTVAAEKKSAIEKAAQDAVAAEKAAELGKKQAQIEFDAQDTANLLKPIAKEAADKVQSAEKAMEKAKEGLLKNEPKKALEPQAKATENLKEARKKLDNLIKEQVATREQTKETEGDKQNLKLPELANKQKELAKQTDQLKNTPLPDNDKKAEKALEKAETAMKQAAKNLDAKQSPEAVAKQDKAIEAL